MIRPFLIILSAICMLSCNAATEPSDDRVNSLIEQEDWFALDAEYASLRPRIKDKTVRLTADAMLSYLQNKPHKAVAYLDTLLNRQFYHRHREAYYSLSMLRCRMLNKVGRYREATMALGKMTQERKAEGASEQDWRPLEDFQAQNKWLDQLPAPSLQRTKNDVSVPFTLQQMQAKNQETWVEKARKDFKGYLLTVEAYVNGQPLQMAFDTGASKTFLSEATAKRMGLRFLPDTITLNGYQQARRAFVDSLRVGQITYHNLIVYVGISSLNALIGTTIDAVLGLDFISAVSETQICFDQRRLIFPAQQTPLPASGRNLYIQNVPYIKANRGNEQLTFVFDTGDTTGSLYYKYFDRHRSEVLQTAERDSIAQVEYGRVYIREVYMLPRLTFTLGHTPVDIEQVYVDPKPHGWVSTADGRMGMDLVHRFRKTTINMSSMFVSIEQ
uniref:Aspartyl protease family protein n=1 Tax=Prevotella sp. GTC17259 TaxID=3236795 RepID=A0AB33IZ12_9BACT